MIYSILLEHASFHLVGMFGPIKLALPCHYLLKWRYLARKMSGHVFVC